MQKQNIVFQLLVKLATQYGIHKDLPLLLSHGGNCRKKVMLKE